MDWAARRRAWSDRNVAGSYDRRRFSGPLGRHKHANDAARVARLLARCGAALRVLDLPCGTGRLVGDLCARGHLVVGLDLSAQMLAVADRPDSPSFRGYVRGEAERLPLLTDSFDAVVSLRFLFHVRDEDVRRRMLGEFGRVAEWSIGQVRSGANLKHWGRRLRRALGGARSYRPASDRATLAAELEAAGLELVGLEPISRVFSDKALFLARRRSSSGPPSTPAVDRDAH